MLIPFNLLKKKLNKTLRVNFFIMLLKNKDKIYYLNFIYISLQDKTKTIRLVSPS